jgi:hypothetical protein
LSVSGNIPTTNNTLNVNGNAVISTNLTVSGNASVTSNLTANGITISSNGLSVSGNIPTTTNTLNVNGNAVISTNLTVSGTASVTGKFTANGVIQFNNYVVNLHSEINQTTNLSSTTLLHKYYKITVGTDITITLPTINSTNINYPINIYKSNAASTSVVTINPASGQKIIKNGTTVQADTFSLDADTTSTTFVATSINSIFCWVEIGAGGGGGGNNLKKGLNVTGNYTGTNYTANFDGNVIATSYNATSDRRLKSNITPLYSQWNAILHIKPVSFDWIQDGRPDIGFIAQEIHSAYPVLRPNHENIDLSKSTIEEPVDLSGNPIYYTIDYGRMTPFLWQGMREIMQRVEQLENENKEFKERIRILEERA